MLFIGIYFISKWYILPIKTLVISQYIYFLCILRDCHDIQYYIQNIHLNFHFCYCHYNSHIRYNIPGDNWIIPDTYHLFNTAKYDTTFSLSDIYSQHKTSVLFLFINKVLYSIGLYSFCIANTAMIIYAFFKHHEDRRFCFVFLVLSPLFFINIPLPSKDIMVTFLFAYGYMQFTLRQAWQKQSCCL